MNFNGGTTAELKKLIIPIMSHLPVMMTVMYHTLPQRHHEQASERGRAAVGKHQPISGQKALVLFFFWLQKTIRQNPDVKRNGSASD